MSTKKITTYMVAAVAVLALASSAFAVPILGLYTDTTDCDSHPTTLFNEEIGDLTVFPTDESIFVDVMPTTTYICVGDDGFLNDWEIRMQNTSSNSFVDLFFVADE
ncbi:MAG: hypothetical protein MI725_07450, partial [Pirellulales bacterium]|nr:hypothetical protein [Pirellulales bacterium]